MIMIYSNVDTVVN